MDRKTNRAAHRVMRAIIADLRNRAGCDHMVDSIAADKPVRQEIVRDWRDAIRAAISGVA
jgi:hypothetical protein